MIRGDLKAAGIPYSDAHGNDYDFHSLRHQFITDLSRAGVSLRAAQELARHSKPELTANIYTHLSAADTLAEVEKLSAVPPVQKSCIAGSVEEKFGPVPGPSSPTIPAPLSDLTLIPGSVPLYEKTAENIGFTAVSVSDADGTRTRNHRIDSPVL